MFIEEYKLIIETNFDSIKNLFYLYSCLPVYYYVEVSLFSQGISYGFQKSHSGENYVKVIISHEKPNPENDKDMLMISYQSLESFFNPLSLGIFDSIQLNEIIPLRGLLYKRLSYEIKRCN